MILQDFNSIGVAFAAACILISISLIVILVSLVKGVFTRKK